MLPALPPPNILFAIADDQSYPYASAYVQTEPEVANMVHTPGFDFVAGHGVAFTNAFATSPGSSPSRASILTGRFPWQIEEAGTHASSFPAKYVCYPDIFAAKGYRVGFTGKGWGPGNWEVSGRKHNPAGPAYNELKLVPPHQGISKIDYSANFSHFLDSLQEGQPFCFWYGAHEPHRPYTTDSWKEEGKSLSDVPVPPYLPDVPVVRGDFLDYAVEIEWFDLHLQRIIEELQKRDMLENTIIIVTADNGMPFPRAKANCYDAGTHVPLAICWGNRVSHPHLEQTIVSLVGELAGQSLSPLLGFSQEAYTSTVAMSGRERHSCARYNNYGYPIRSIRSGQYQLIRNFHPERWPAGAPFAIGQSNLQKGYADIDDCPTKTFMISHREEAEFAPFFEAAVSKRPEYELFDLQSDPYCLHNLAGNPEYHDLFIEMKMLLENRLVGTGDTRLVGNDPDVWEHYPRLAGPMREFPDEP